MAVTVVLSNDDDFWVVVAARGRAHAVDEGGARRAQEGRRRADRACTASRRSPTAPRTRSIGSRGASPIPTSWADDLAQAIDAIVDRSVRAGDVTRGKKEIAKLWKKRAKVNVRHASAGEITAATTADGQLAWVTAPVVRFADDDEPLPLRLFSVFEKTDGEWKMIALQESLALDEPGVGRELQEDLRAAVEGRRAAAAQAQGRDEAEEEKEEEERAS